MLNLRWAGYLMAAELVLGTVGFMVLENYDLMEAIYMTVITISTVGFTEVEPLSPVGRVFTSIFILINIGVFAYLLAAFSFFVIEGKLFTIMHQNRIQARISELQGHVILCGYGKYGHEIAANLANHKTPFVIIEMSENRIEELQNGEEGEYLFIAGDATRDETLQQAGIGRAQGLIAALSDDSDNLFIVLSARQLNPGLRIISRAVQPGNDRKMRKAGANHVVMPEQIGGFYIATLINKPGAVEFFSFITNEFHTDIGFEEILYDHLPAGMRGKSIRDWHIRSTTGVNIIGWRNHEGRYQVNPGPDTILQPGDSFIVIGSDEQLQQLREEMRN